MKRYLIVGGVAGGATAAARLRRNDEKCEIVMFERGEYISYANCGLPYYIGGVISNRNALFVQTPEAFRKRFNVDVRVKNEVLSIDKSAKKVTVRDLVSGKEYQESYDKLIVSPGAEPVRPPIEGINNDAIFTLRNVPDTDKIANYIKENKCVHATVIGAGFIGLEMAENLHHLGMNVTIVEMADQVMTVLDYEMAAGVHQHLKSKNVEFYLGDGVSSFGNSDTRKLSVKLKSGREVHTDLVILSIGVKPDTKLIKDAGIALTDRGSIIVDEFMRTSDKDIYALGDAIIFNNPIINKPLPAYLAGPANKQGRIVANNIIFGDNEKYKGSIATAIAKIFDLTVASTGLSEKILKSENIPYYSTITHSNSHAGYYPGAMMMSTKLLYSPEGKIFGAQIVGYEGVDNRINMIAAIIGMKGDITDLHDLEHAYAPPYSSAKDPVNIAGFTAENVLKGTMKIKRWDEIPKLDRSEWVLVDVRTKDENALGSIDGSMNIPVDELRERIGEIPKGKKVLIYCAVGLRGYVGARILMQNGFSEVYNLTGGYKTYSQVTQKQSNEEIFANALCEDESCVQKTDLPVGKTYDVDACGLQCPGPIVKLKSEMEKIAGGDMLSIKASDPGFGRDVGAWCTMTGNRLVSLQEGKNEIVAVVQKGGGTMMGGSGKNKTIVLFSDDLDRALASFVIANGAATTGHKVTIFFTFWGLNLIKKRRKPSVSKDIMGRMFSFMMPSSSLKTKLSKMNMMGLGTKMMRWRMKSKNVDSLEAMIGSAKLAGVEFIACQMSMDVMGVKAEELLDGVRIGGVATYLNEAEGSNLNLFI